MLKILHIISNIQNFILILTNKCVHDKEKDTSSYTPTLSTHAFEKTKQKCFIQKNLLNEKKGGKMKYIS